MDQRQQPRVKNCPPLDIEVIELSPHFHEQQFRESTKALNMSEGGMLYISKISRKPGTVLMAQFTLPDTSISMRTTFNVIHCTLEWPIYHIGVQFKDLGIAERKLLRDFLQMEMIKDE